MKFRLLIAVSLAVLMIGGLEAQEKPLSPEDRKALEAEKAGQERLVKMAAEQAEAIAKASLKVAQDAAREAEARGNTVIPVDVEVVISRFQGDKRVSSLPYSLSVNATYEANPRMTSLRMGGQIPVPFMAVAPGADGKPAGLVPTQYRDVGTQIDAQARILDEGRFDLFLTVEETAIATAPGGAGADLAGGPPVLRTFSSSNNLVLRDGQSRQFTAASDRITGEVVRVDVTLRVVK